MLLMIVFISSASVAKTPHVFFEPVVVKLEGTIRTLKFPGPPNYESIKNGDADETGPYLILNNPIDIQLVPKIQIGNDEPEKNVKLIQLVVRDNNDWRYVKEGNYIQIKGTLFHASTGHHHARVLLWINKIEVISTHKVADKKINFTKEDREYLEHEYLQN